MVSRSLICCLLLVLAGCDRQTAAPAQPNTSVAADEVAPDEVTAAPKPVEKLDRSHKGDVASDMPFDGPDGKPVTLADFRGKPVLLNLWATWCAPCVAELPTLDALAKSGKVRVIAVSQDQDVAKVRPFLDRRRLSLTPYTDGEMGLSLAKQANLPTTFLYDAAGREVWRMSGGFAWDEAEAAKLIAEAG